MGTPIYVDDPMKDFNSHLLKLMLAKQQREEAEEQLKLKKKDLELRQQQHAAEQQEAASSQAQAMQTFMQAQMNPDTASMTVPGLQALGNANVPNAQAFGEVNAVAAPQTMGGKAMPSAIDQKRMAMQEERATAKYMDQLRGHLTAEEFSQFRAAVGLVQNGVPKEMVDSFLPESAKEAADRLKTLAEAAEITDRAESNRFAQDYLQKTYGIVVGADKANETLRSLTLADRQFAQARALQREREAAADRRANTAAVRAMQLKAKDIESGLRNNFEQSPIVKQASSVAFSYNKIVQAAEARTGASDQAIVYAFINMQDNTAARDSERAALQKAGSVSEYISAKFGNWKEGTTFSESQRQKIVDAASDMMLAQQGVLGSYVEHYTKLATESGIDPTRVTFNPYAGVESPEDREARRRVREARGKKE